MELEIKETADGDLFFELPQTLLDRLNWKTGDDIKFIEQDGGFIIKKIKYETIELEFDDEELFKYMKHAHEQHMSFDDWIGHACECMIDQLDSKTQSLSGI